MIIDIKLPLGIYPSEYFDSDFDFMMDRYLDNLDEDIPKELIESATVYPEKYYDEVLDILINQLNEYLNDYEFKDIVIDKEFSKIKNTSEIVVSITFNENIIDLYIEKLHESYYYTDSLYELGLEDSDLSNKITLITMILNTLSFEDGFMSEIEDKLFDIKMKKYIDL